MQKTTKWSELLQKLYFVVNLNIMLHQISTVLCFMPYVKTCKITERYRQEKQMLYEVSCSGELRTNSYTSICIARSFLILHKFCLINGPGVVKQLLEELEKTVKTLEDKYRAKAKAKMTGQGKPGELLIHIAKEENASMIITGSRGLGKIRRTILGSVSDYVIHHSHVPVLVCKA
ncbi:unnamed protein product [Mytilus edulis]|uniref:UspA domain-containing protein n=1 Tax=Mytilus edulis TaxID=6550 RepID=A0A8S3QAP4_MYTED|nr:unnamed protein product [Mytilus edulis]